MLPATKTDNETEVAPYYQEVRDISLLTIEQEQAIGKRIAAGRAAEAVPAMRRSDQHLYAIADALAARNELVEANLRWALAIANKYRGHGFETDDLVQVANEGLMRAAAKYDHTVGRFTTYATWWIRQAITRSLADHSRMIRLPVHASDTFVQARRAMVELTNELQRTPTTLEVAGRIGQPVKKLQHILRIGAGPASLNAPVSKGNDDPAELGDFIAVEGESPEAEAARSETRAIVRAAIEKLPLRMATVLKLRFGLDDDHPRTLEEVGRHLGMTRERARQIEAEAFRKLRHPALGKGLYALLSTNGDEL